MSGGAEWASALALEKQEYRQWRAMEGLRQDELGDSDANEYHVRCDAKFQKSRRTWRPNAYIDAMLQCPHWNTPLASRGTETTLTITKGWFSFFFARESRARSLPLLSGLSEQAISRRFTSKKS